MLQSLSSKQSGYQSSGSQTQKLLQAKVRNLEHQNINLIVENQKLRQQLRLLQRGMQQENPPPGSISPPSKKILGGMVTDSSQQQQKKKTTQQQQRKK